MPVISRKIIRKPRKKRICDDCGKDILFESVRLYGHAEKGDKPWVAHLHPECDNYKEKVVDNS